MAITEDIVRETAAVLYEKALKELPDDIVDALKEALASESNSIARLNLEVILKNARLAKEKGYVICQDTCIPSYWLKIGAKAILDGDPIMAIKEGAQIAAMKVPVIPHCVHPITRVNTGTNVGDDVPVLHIELLPFCDYIEITAVPIGAGSETAPSTLRIFSQADSFETIKKFILDSVINAGGNPCPPTIVGVGLGTSFDHVAHLAKAAAFRPLNKRHPDPTVAKLERELLTVINQIGIGPMGMGGDTTSLAVNIEIGHTHRPCQPVAVKLQCWAVRRTSARINSNGRVEIL